MNYFNTNFNSPKIVLISSEKKTVNKIVISDIDYDCKEFNDLAFNDFSWAGKKENEDFEMPINLSIIQKQEKNLTEISKKETEPICEIKIELQNNEGNFIYKENINNNNSNLLLNKKTKRLNENTRIEVCTHSKKQKKKKKFFITKTMENKDKKIKTDHHNQNKNELFTISKIIRFYPPYTKKGT